MHPTMFPLEIPYDRVLHFLGNMVMFTISLGKKNIYVFFSFTLGKPV